ncbi:F-box/LRR-repeat protein 15 isoform X2 [Physcomitrium patens]|uniref:F-box domain-containing protein n=1 Tax=Physcomitrium patens TaxID=3218 RepID=A0A2K1JR47_PHYPA|nr:F-box/LRR-repeat protein 15-like isoform X2 [Physcomitrium patens]PNR44013.1 hypothetical protein PHYPA_016396 [Physcomitrium patens]|eukprot:XP_024391133.1 F-box/LRR-repeat protein 15-like isoform X2 [Physcomitrella patens]
MAADNTLGSIMWLADGLLIRPETLNGGKPKALSDIDWHVNSRKESRDVDQPTESGRIVLQDEEILTDLDHSVPNESSISSIRQTFKGQWSSDLLSVSPTHSPRFWRRDTDNQVLQAESLGMFYDENEVHESASVEETPFQRLDASNSQENRNFRLGLNARSLMPDPTTPQKIHLHRKRAKFIPLLSRQHPPSAMAGGSSIDYSSSSSRQSLQFESFPREGLSLDPSFNHPSQLQGRREDSMETDNAGDEDKDENVEEANDNELRFGLTDDLLLKVFSFLDHVTLCHAAMVCRQWRAASAHEDFWKSLNFEYRQVTHAQVAELCARYPRATELHLKNTANVEEERVRDAMSSLRNLEVLTLGGNLLNEPFFQALSNSTSLRTLSISDASLGSGGAQEVHLRHEGLLSLQIIKCRVLRISVRCPQLEKLSLKQSGAASALLHCPLLTSLDVTSCHKLSDAGVRAAAITCPLLTCLNVSNCAYVTDDTLREISLVCTYLQILDASHCPNISLEGVRMPMLTELRLQNCEGINASSMAALSHCIMLEVLAMDCCWLLTSVNLDLPHLRSISLANNKKLVELTLRSPFLVSLDLTNCPALSRINLSSSSLPILDLKNQSSLASFVLHCPWLQVVDLSECESLTDLVCNVFSEGGGCPKLNTLILDNCDHLHLDGCNQLVVASFAPVGLLSLNLGICPHLTSLVIKADQMSVLDLRGCGILSQASIDCPNLSSLDASYCSELGDLCLATTTSACPAIQQLVLAACSFVGPAGLFALKKLVDLTVLDLSYTFLTDMSPIFEACPRLKVLRLSACKYLEETTLDALHGGNKLPELQELDLSYGSLGRRAIEDVLAHCPHLVHVSLNGCANVTDHFWAHLCSQRGLLEPIDGTDTLSTDAVTADSDVDQDGAWDANSALEVVVGNRNSIEAFTPERALQSLSCVGCHNVRSVTITAQTCPYLSIINLSLSNNIREIYLACANLVSLNLSNCAALSLLDLDCPRLIALSLHGCRIESHVLEVGIQGCTMLETLDLRNCTKITFASLATFRGLCPNIKRLYSTALSE